MRDLLVYITALFGYLPRCVKNACSALLVNGPISMKLCVEIRVIGFIWCDTKGDHLWRECCAQSIRVRQDIFWLALKKSKESVGVRDVVAQGSVGQHLAIGCNVGFYVICKVIMLIWNAHA